MNSKRLNGVTDHLALQHQATNYSNSPSPQIEMMSKFNLASAENINSKGNLHSNQLPPMPKYSVNSPDMMKLVPTHKSMKKPHASS